jgi:hypothetical protein
MLKSATRSAFVLGLAVTSAPALQATQLPLIPYDAAAVRRQAENIFKEIDDIEHGGPGDRDEGAKLQFIVQSLMSVTDLSTVEPRVLEALVTQAGTGRMATDAILRFGDRAVAPLIASARTTLSTGTHQRAGALRCLAEILHAGLSPPLTPASRAGVTDLARDKLAARSTPYVELAAAGVLAVATGDRELRASASRLVDPSELTARGIDSRAQTLVIKSVTDALAKFPAR